MRRLLLTFLLLAGCTQGHDAEFERDRWQNADLGTRERAGMVDSLLREHPLKGMDRPAVIALLGQPTPTDKWEGTEMIYVLGPDAGMAIDHEWLLIELDQQDRVSEYAVVSD